MKTRSSMKRFAAGVLAASALVGCSMKAPSAAPPPAVTPAELTPPGLEVLVKKDGVHSEKMKEFLAQLALSEDQKTQLKAVVKDAFAKAKSMHERIKPLLTGETVDTSLLEPAIASALKEDAANDAETMQAMRDVLNSEQRTLIAKTIMKLSQKPVDEDPHTKLFNKLMDKAAEQVSLSESQKAGFAQMKSDLMAFWTENRVAYYAAMAKHMEDGDKQALQAKFEELIENWKTDSAVSFIASLDQSQRQTMIAWKEGWLDKIAGKL